MTIKLFTLLQNFWMKPGITIFGAVLIFLIACNQQKTGTEEHKDDSDIPAAKTETVHHETVLTLNDGKKWKLDEPTRTNLQAIQKIFDESLKEPIPVYSTLASKLQESANKLVSECKMSGKDHDMLHAWLERFFSALMELKSAEPDKQETAYHTIEQLLKNFDSYFE